jgi:hypothetical protein
VERIGRVCGDKEFVIRIVEISVEDPSEGSRVEEHQGRSRGEKEKVKMYHRRQEQQHVRDRGDKRRSTGQ